MQRITIIGNLTKDPELRVTSSGINVCSFSVAVSRRGKGDDKVTDFFRVNAWRGLAESCNKFLSKGRKVYVSGELQARTYEASDGSTRMSLDIQADEVEFLTPKSDKSEAEPEQEPTIDDFKEIKNDDLPF